MKNATLIIVAAALVAGAAGFFGGMQYQRMQVRNGFRQFAGAAGGGNFPQRDGVNGQAGGRNGGGRVVGQILNMDANSITVKLPDGSSKIVILSDQTVYSKTSQGSKNDLKTGDNVGIFGAANSDGSITAADVQINPAFRNSSPSGTPSAN